MRKTIHHILLALGTSSLLIFSVTINAANPPESKQKQHSPALRACFDNCRVHKKQEAYETCVDKCIETDKSKSLPAVKK